MKALKTVDKCFDAIFWFNESLCKILLTMIFVLMWVVVFGRYFFSFTPPWSEDLILFSVCWLAMLSGAEAFRRNGHIRITAFVDLLPKKAGQILQVVTDIISCLFFAYMIYVAYQQVLSNVTVYYTGFKISKMWCFLCFPISFALMIAAKMQKYIKQYLQKQEGEAK